MDSKRVYPILGLIVIVLAAGGYWYLTNRPKTKTDMVAYWSFDEAEGDIAHDDVGENHGTVYGATWTDGKVNGALGFDGIDDRVKLPESTISGTTLSICLWVKTSDTYFALISGANQTYDNELLLSLHSSAEGRLSMLYHDNQGIRGDRYYRTNVTFNDEQWHMLTIVIEADGSMVYLDGVLEEDNDYGSGDGFMIEGLWIGGEQDTVDGGWQTIQQYSGLVDELAIFDRVLTSEEIEQFYNWGLDGIGYYG
jgi:hypothetical protein